MEVLVFSVIIPVYNEEKVLDHTYTRLTEVMEEMGETYELIFVDDGSSDGSGTWIRNLCNLDQRVKLLAFSRNFGQQAAMSAGVDFAFGQAVVFIDADLQDPPEVIPELAVKWREGYQVVYGKRIKRQGEKMFKKLSAAFFYRLLRHLTSQSQPVDVGDFRLVDQQVCAVLRSLPEKNKYLRGLVSWTGFKQTEVEYIRKKRVAGTTKYSFGKMFNLSLNAITSFSYKPLKIATVLGLLLSVFSFSFIFYVVYLRVFTDRAVPGWASLMAINLFFNGVVLVILGIMGEYIARIYEESKNRPSYVISEKVGKFTE